MNGRPYRDAALNASASELERLIFAVVDLADQVAQARSVGADADFGLPDTLSMLNSVPIGFVYADEDGQEWVKRSSGLWECQCDDCRRLVHPQVRMTPEQLIEDL